MSVAENNKVLPMPDHGIVAYTEFRNQLAELKEINEKTVFQYQDPNGNKAARSYIRKLRLTKGEVERVRKQEKAASLEYGRRVDAGAKEIIGELETMIEVHQKPLDEIEAKEASRVAAIRERIERIKALQQETESLDSKETTHNLERLRAVSIDSSFAEFQEEAKQELELAIQKQQHQHTFSVLREADADRQEQARIAESTRLQKEREDKIAEESAAKAKADAERIAADRIANAEAATKRAQLEAEQSAQRERDKIAAEQKADADAAAKREADKKHRAKINNEILSAFTAAGIIEEIAKTVITIIVKGDVPHIKIVY